MRPLIYVAGPYRAHSPRKVAANVRAAAAVGLHLARKGWCPIVPHVLTQKLATLDTTESVSEDEWLDVRLSMALKCDAGFFLDGWRKSEGAVMEANALRENDIPYWEDIEHVPPAEDFWDWDRGRENEKTTVRNRGLHNPA